MLTMKKITEIKNNLVSQEDKDTVDVIIDDISNYTKTIIEYNYWVCYEPQDSRERKIKHDNLTNIEKIKQREWRVIVADFKILKIISNKQDIPSTSIEIIECIEGILQDSINLEKRTA